MSEQRQQHHHHHHLGTSRSNDGRPRLAPLLPAPLTRGLPSRTRAEKRKGTSACETCHSRKIKCDAGRPQCSSCIGRSTAPCRYATTSNETHSEARRRKRNTLESQNTLLQNIFQLLQSRPEHEAYELLGRIRTGEGAESIVNHVRDGDLLLQMSLVPESRLIYEFPLVHDMPHFLQVQDNPYLNSALYQHAKAMSERCPSSTQAPSPYSKPFHAAVIIDPILAAVKPSRWTTISTNDELMRDLLRAYFSQEYLWFTFVHKDLFLEDMMSGGTSFCSPLLVNAVLAYSCHCHRTLPGRANYWDPATFAYRFLAEAKRLWDLEQRRSRLTTVQTGLFLNAISNLDGVDAVGRQYTVRAIEMALDMKLFSAREPSQAVDIKMQICREYTAWVLFCWQGMISHVMFHPPLIHPPPENPLPDPDIFPQWYGEIWIKYPLDTVPIAAHHGHDFRSRARLLCIMNEMCLRYFSSPPSPDARLIQTMLYFHGMLRAWFDALPAPLTVARLAFPSHLKLHMQYNHLLINLFKPWVELSPTTPEYMAFVNQVGQSPVEATTSATIRMETLFRMYYLRHGFDAMDGYMVHFFNHLGYMSMELLKTTSDPAEANSRRCLLLMCALGLREQGQYYYLVRTIFHLFRAGMSPEDVAVLNRYAREQQAPGAKDELHRPQDIDSEYPLNMIDISGNPETKRVTYRVREEKDSLEAEMGD